MPIDNSSIILTTQSITGAPSENGLQMLTDSLLEFLLYEQSTETAIPGKEAAVSKQEAVTGLHCIQNSIQNGENKQWT